MKKLNWIVGLLLIGLVACEDNSSTNDSGKSNEKPLVEDTANIVDEVEVKTNVVVSDEELLNAVAEVILRALIDENYSMIDLMVDPGGVYFSPVVSRSLEEMYLMKSSLSEQLVSKETIDWGIFSASGESTHLSFKDYFFKYVNDVHFYDATRHVNEYTERGNRVNKMKENFPNAELVECNYEGTEANEMMDWKSLNLVFLKKGDDYYLKAVINDQWSI